MASRFTYVYRSSDGRRRTDEMSAESREEVFERLRGRGIKPIKVIANDGSRANGEDSVAAESAPRKAPYRRWVAAVVSVVGVVAAAWLLWRGGAAGRSPEYARLVDEARRIQGEMDSRIAALDIDLLQNYALIENTPDASPFYASVAQASGEVEKAKERLRSAFKDVEGTFSDPEELGLAQKLYGEAAEAIDAAGQAIAFRGYAFMLLDENRGKWKTERDGDSRRIVWSDTTLEQRFSFYSKGGVSSATMRWKRDFAPTVLRGVNTSK